MGSGVSKPISHNVDVITGRGSKDLLKYKHYLIYKDIILGSGTFGNVYKGYDKGKKRLIAAKHIPHASHAFSQTEVDVLMNLTEHDNVVRIYDSFIHEDNTRYIIMQYCDGPCLDAYMQLKNPSLPTRLEIIFQMIETMQFMHFATPPTAHRDLKPSNIIIVHGSHIKLCDFGLAKFVDVQKTLNASTAGGTPNYMSPEIHAGKKYNAILADVFSAGLVFLAIATFTLGKNMDHVFRSVLGIGHEMNQEGCQDVLQRKLDGLDYRCEQTMALISLIARMVEFTPKQRPDFNEIFRIFISDIIQAQAAERRGSESRRTSDASSDDATYTDPVPNVPLGGARRKVPLHSDMKSGVQQEERRRHKSGPSGDRDPGLTTPRHLLREQTDETTVIIGGRVEGNKRHNKIIHLNNQKKSVPLPETVTNCDFYSVCAEASNIYISGGYDSTLKKSITAVYLYTLISDEWIQLTDLPSARSEHGSVCVGKLLYIVGGVYAEDDEIKQYHRTIHVLDITDLSWSTVEDLPYGVMCPGVAAVDGDIYVMGGENSDGDNSRKVVKYQPSTKRWTDRREMPVFMDYFVASTIPVGKKIFVLAHNTFMEYDTERDHWTTHDAPPIPSYWCSMVYIDGALLALGGFEDKKNVGVTPHNRVQRYDLRSQKWSVLEDTMPVALSYHYSFVVRVPRSS